MNDCQSYYIKQSLKQKKDQIQMPCLESLQSAKPRVLDKLDSQFPSKLRKRSPSKEQSVVGGQFKMNNKHRNEVQRLIDNQNNKLLNKLNDIMNPRRMLNSSSRSLSPMCFNQISQNVNNSMNSHTQRQANTSLDQRRKDNICLQIGNTRNHGKLQSLVNSPRPNIPFATKLVKKPNKMLIQARKIEKENIQIAKSIANCKPSIHFNTKRNLIQTRQSSIGTKNLCSSPVAQKIQNIPKYIHCIDNPSRSNCFAESEDETILCEPRYPEQIVPQNQEQIKQDTKYEKKEGQYSNKYFNNSSYQKIYLKKQDSQSSHLNRSHDIKHNEKRYKSQTIFKSSQQITNSTIHSQNIQLHNKSQTPDMRYLWNSVYQKKDKQINRTQLQAEDTSCQKQFPHKVCNLASLDHNRKNDKNLQKSRGRISLNNSSIIEKNEFKSSGAKLPYLNLSSKSINRNQNPSENNHSYQTRFSKNLVQQKRDPIYNDEISDIFDSEIKQIQERYISLKQFYGDEFQKKKQYRSQNSQRLQ